MNKRVDGLNFIRIIGMTTILLFHARLIYGFQIGVDWIDELIFIGAIFITVFFMLSGFGLRKSNPSLTIHDKNRLKRYYKKRILTIYPLFLLLTIVALLFQFRMMDTLEETLLRLPIQFSMLHILLGKEMHGFLFNDNCWYISALFVLYLLFPFLNMFVNRLSVRAKVGLCVVLWMLSFGIYAFFVFQTEQVFLDYYPNPFLRIPEFLIGMLLADLSEQVDEKWDYFGKYCGVIVVFTAVFATVCISLLRPYFLLEINLYNLVVIPSTSVIFLCVTHWDWLNQLGRTKLVRWLAGLGLEMYLCQSFAILTLTLIKVDSRWDELAFIGLTVVFAVVVNTGGKVIGKKMARG